MVRGWEDALEEGYEAASGAQGGEDRGCEGSVTLSRGAKESEASEGDGQGALLEGALKLAVPV